MSIKDYKALMLDKVEEDMKESLDSLFNLYWEYIEGDDDISIDEFADSHGMSRTYLHTLFTAFDIVTISAFGEE